MRTIVDDHGVTSKPGDTGLEVQGELVVKGTSVLGELAELKRVVAQLQELLNPTPQPFQTFLPPSMAAQLPEERAAHGRELLKAESTPPPSAEPSVPVVAINFPGETFPWETDPSPKGSSEPPLETPPAPPVVAKAPAAGKVGSAKAAKASK